VNTTIIDEVTRYASEVEATCADLSAKQRQALLGDPPEHLREVAASGSLQAQLGSPQQYADEIRAAAGLPPRPVAENQEPVPWWRTIWRDLLPAWWVLRCYLAVWVWALVTQNWTYSFNTFPFPAPLGHPGLGLVATVLLIPPSLWLGHRHMRQPVAAMWVVIQVATTVYLLAFVSQAVGIGPNAASTQHATYQYSCCQPGTLVGPHQPGDALTVHWIVTGGGWSYQNSSPVTLRATLAGSFDTAAAAKPDTTARTIATADPIHTTTAAGGSPVSTIHIPTNAPPGYYDLRFSITMPGGGSSSGTSIIKVGK
jgi:hypothetical protein